MYQREGETENKQNIDETNDDKGSQGGTGEEQGGAEKKGQLMSSIIFSAFFCLSRCAHLYMTHKGIMKRIIHRK